MTDSHDQPPRKQFPELSVPDFIRPFDEAYPTVDEAEKVTVAAKFSSLVKDIMLNFPEDIVNHTDRSDCASEEDLTLLRKPPDRSRWGIGVIQRNYDEHIPQIETSIPQEIVLDGHIIGTMPYFGGPDGKGMSYELAADGVVRRWDYSPRTKARDRGLLRRSVHLDITGEAAVAKSEHLQNRSLEQEFAVNGQPVTLQELDGLADFLSSADPLRL